MSVSWKGVAMASMLAVIIFAVAYGIAASMDVNGVEGLGSGSARVNAPPNVRKVEWILSSSDPGKVVGVVVYFEKDVDVGGTVYVALDDTYPVKSPYLGTGSQSFKASDDITKGVKVTITPNVDAEKVCGILITCVTEAYK